MLIIFYKNSGGKMISVMTQVCSCPMAIVYLSHFMLFV